MLYPKIIALEHFRDIDKSKPQWYIFASVSSYSVYAELSNIILKKEKKWFSLTTLCSFLVETLAECVLQWHLTEKPQAPNYILYTSISL